jgi:hypothetical protein
MKLLLKVQGDVQPSGELHSLQRALLADPELRSVGLTLRAGEAEAGAMGPVADGLLIFFGAGGLGVTVIQGVCNWLANRRGNVRLSITEGEAGSRTVEVEVTNARRPEVVVELLREAGLLPPPAASPAPETGTGAGTEAGA